MSEDWHNPNRPKLKNIKDEDVAYELRELSKYTSLTPEIINIICHGYARICQLERERDEARRDVCSMMHMTGFLGGDYAHSKGWDCFKDGHTGFSPEIQNFRDIFYGYKDKLRAERDEARRNLCDLYVKGQPSSSNMTAHDYAAELGWDCYKEDGK